MNTSPLEALIVALLGILAATLHMAYLLKDDRTPNHTKEDLLIKRYWHIFGGVLHIWMGYVMQRAYGPGWGLFTGAAMWMVFDGVVNYIALRKEWWFIGSTAILDRVQVWLGNHFKVDPRTVSATLKCMLLAASIINLFIV